MLHLSLVLKYHLYFNLSSWGKAYLIDDESRDNNKQSGYVQIHERARKVVEGIVDEFCLIFSSIKAVSLQLGRDVAKYLVQNRTEAFCALLLHYQVTSL